MMHSGGGEFPAEILSAVFTDTDGRQWTSLTFADLSSRRRSEEALRLLADAGATLGASLDPHRTLRNLAELVIPRFADVCLIDLVQDGVLRRVAESEIDASLASAMSELGPPSLPLRFATAGPQFVLRTGHHELVESVTEAWIEAAVPTERMLQAMRQIAFQSTLLVPIKIGGRPHGMVSLGRLSRRRRFDAEDVPLAEALADRTAMAIEHARLYADSVEAAKMRDNLLAIVSHDLRNPLTVVSTAAAVLLEKGGPHANLVTSIRNAAGRAQKLVEDLLSTAMVDAHALSLERRPESIPAILREVASIHRPLAEAKSVELFLEAEGDEIEANVDRHRLLQALGNLVDNAIKFSGAGGRVELTAARSGAALLLEVRDFGPGILAEHLPRIFDRFWQASQAERAGAGLGLSIVKGIVDAHGGQIRVQSRPGQGTTFTILLPARCVRLTMRFNPWTARKRCHTRGWAMAVVRMSRQKPDGSCGPTTKTVSAAPDLCTALRRTSTPAGYGGLAPLDGSANADGPKVIKNCVDR
jgi:signal transduction histidine kinase